MDFTLAKKAFLTVGFLVHVKQTEQIIDCHIHRYPPEVFTRPMRWAEKWREFYWGKLVTAGGESSLQGWADRDKLLSDMEEAGIAKGVLLGWYWEHWETCLWHNEWQARWLKEDANRFLAFVAVHPEVGWARCLETLEWAYAEGFAGIGEVFPVVQGFSMEDPVWLQIVEWAVAHEWPITMHVTEPVGPAYFGRRESSLAEYFRLASRFPSLQLILAHWGGLLPFYELNRFCREGLKNVYYDTAASSLLYDSRVYRLVVAAVGAEKVLFGSDYPLRVFPREQNEPDFVRMVRQVKEAGLSEEEREAVLFKNARRLFFLRQN